MDVRLGVRMLVRYPGLTIVGGVAVAFAIAIGAATFEAVTQLLAPAIPLEDGARIVGIRNWDVEARTEERHAARDFLRWREELGVLEEISAFRTVERNLIVDRGGAEPVTVAEVTASAFRLARVAAVRGRPLLESDEAPGAPPVVVIGYDVWTTRFNGNPLAVGQTVQLGRSPATVVGIMPPGFAFPVSHGVWSPLRLTAGTDGAGAELDIRVFGRLAPGVSRDQAQAALTAAALRASALSPTTHARLRPEIVPYARSVVDVSEIVAGGVAANVFVLLFLGLVCTNVGALVLARTLSRQSEIAVRSALGASRARIVTQLFAEALVLGTVACVIGLGVAQFVLAWWMSVATAEAGGQLPFWLHASLSPATVGYAAALTVLAALIAGVWPALRVTGRRLEGELRQNTAGRANVGFGSAWTLVIVAQVAMTVTIPAAAFFARQHVAGVQSFAAGFPVAEFLAARLSVDTASEGFGNTYGELTRRLAGEAAVVGVTFTDRLPRTTHPERRIAVDGSGSPSETTTAQRVNRASVGVNYFDVLGAPVVAGRGFGSSDLHSDARIVVVNQSFVRQVLGDHNAVGRRVRYARSNGEAEGPWYEIVGVVPDLGMIHDDPRNGAGIYHPATPEAVTPVHIALRVRGEPRAFASRLRAIAAAVDPALRLQELQPLNEAGATLWMELDFLWRILAIVSLVALLLSLSGIYSVMSFAVSRRTREIGIRIALGADRRQIIVAIFSRALAQVALGICAGGVIVFALTRTIAGLSTREVGFVTAYIVLMTLVCLLACIVPTRRALRVEPTVALKPEP